MNDYEQQTLRNFLGNAFDFKDKRTAGDDSVAWDKLAGESDLTLSTEPEYLPTFEQYWKLLRDKPAELAKQEIPKSEHGRSQLPDDPSNFYEPFTPTGAAFSEKVESDYVTLQELGRTEHQSDVATPTANTEEIPNPDEPLEDDPSQETPNNDESNETQDQISNENVSPDQSSLSESTPEDNADKVESSTYD